ncbi:MAG: D-tyrosyl-tRNA(Tyr) deacylase [Desulfohalobiaceae bacterium]|nr:D-tyrosyl-tRNA(Tyr) deacylase [Desulfohalobiaceae bacterium]
MRIVLQRVKQASIEIKGREVAAINRGLLLFLGFGTKDGTDLPGSAAWEKMLARIPELRIFPDHDGKFNLSLNHVRGDLLLVSQFTLFGDCRKGRRPSFSAAADPQLARSLYDSFLQDLDRRAPGKVESGRFGAEMDVLSTNQGPVTMILDSEQI